MWALIKRNTKIYFKDKSLFFSSLITPLILLFLFVTFLRNVYVDSILLAIPDGVTIEASVVNGFAGSWLISSILATSCITIAFCANMVMVQDKVTGSFKDLTITPVKPSVLTLSYYISTAFVTAIVCYTTFGVGLIYLAFTGFYLSFADILLTILDVALLVMFGTALSTIVCLFLNSQGGISAVATLVSSMYGFICGAYMPLSEFSKTLQTILMFLPGTYGTGLLRTHLLNGVLNEMNTIGLSPSVTDNLSKSFDATLVFFNHTVPVWAMYFVLAITIAILISIFLILTKVLNKSTFSYSQKKYKQKPASTKTH